MSEIETYIAGEQFFGGGGLFEGPQAGRENLGLFLSAQCGLRGNEPKAPTHQRPRGRDPPSCPRGGFNGERLLHASCILWGKGSAEAKSLLVSTLSQP